MDTWNDVKEWAPGAWNDAKEWAQGAVQEVEELPLQAKNLFDRKIQDRLKTLTNTIARDFHDAGTKPLYKASRGWNEFPGSEGFPEQIWTAG